MRSPIPPTPEPAFSSRAVCQLLDEGRRKIELLLTAGLPDLVVRQERRITKAKAYLSANFPPTALTRGPRPR